MILAIIIGSAISLLGGVILLRFKRQRRLALLLTLPFGAGALLAAAFFDLLPEAFDTADPRAMLYYCLGGFLFFFVAERSAGWFHSHHEHDHYMTVKNTSQRRLIVIGDLIHNAIDGLAIGAAFLVSIPTGIVTTLAVSAHEIPKELGTFALLADRGWRDRTVIIANIFTAIATILSAIAIYIIGEGIEAFVPPLLAITSGFFIYIAASDIIPDIHEQPRRIGTVQALMLLTGVVLVGNLILLLGV